ncbi:MAG TPA: hypothetical protein VGV59_06445 [Pyrinomonadaceae bacterium]|nr:hypothetical protein [Pyrinomonadaceae bacterium]
MRAKGRRLILCFVILALAGLGVAVWRARTVRRETVSAEPDAATTPLPAAERRTLPPLPQRTLSPRLAAARERAMRAASEMRGLAWTGAVGMTELSGWEYGTRTRELADVLGTEDLKGMSKLAVAGGLLPEGTDLASLAVTFTAATAGATYSPLDKQVLFVAEDSAKGARPDNSLLTHEFVHALQDQHFDLLKMLDARPYNFDRTEAMFALVEGDAMNVQRRLEAGSASVWARRTVEEIARQEDERFGLYRRGVGALFPPLLTETFIFRYRDGARFVEAVRRSRPGASVDELFRRPPASSEQVLHPEKYLAGETPREAEVNAEGFSARGWRAAASTPLGEVGVRGLLLAGVSAEEARRASAGWGGDRAYVFEREGRTPLFVWKTVWDGREDAREFFRAYNALKAGRAARVDDAAAGMDAGGESQAVWREGAFVTLVRLEGEGVVVVRGVETDVRETFEAALR